MVIRAILKAGHTGYWVPDAVVHHHIPTSRQTTAYVERYYRGLGETWVLETDREKLRSRAWHQTRCLANYLLYRLSPRLGGVPWVRFLSGYAFHSGVLNLLERTRIPARHAPQPLEERPPV